MAPCGRQVERPPSGAYGSDGWLRLYAAHLEIHSAQILRNLEAWKVR